MERLREDTGVEPEPERTLNRRSLQGGEGSERSARSGRLDWSHGFGPVIAVQPSCKESKHTDADSDDRTYPEQEHAGRTAWTVLTANAQVTSTRCGSGTCGIHRH